MKTINRPVFLAVILFACAPGVFGQAKSDSANLTPVSSRYQQVMGTKGMVVADDRQAAEWGVEILREGGNAVDAAVATGFALAVTRPQFASLGGGGFMLYCASGGKDCQVIDYREVAPAAAKRDMYIKEGKALPDLSQNGALASGVPGVPAGLLLAHKMYGTIPLSKLLSRPIELAQKGYPFTAYGEQAAEGRWKYMNGAAKELFGCRAKASEALEPCAPGAVIKQPDLARVLETISKSGAKGFYEGWVAKNIAKEVQKAGGILTEADLKAYQPKMRVPLRGRYHGLEVVTMPPPSSGGAIVLQLLNYAQLAEKSGAFSAGFGSAQAVHALVHAMSLAFADRAEFFGDPDFVKVPIGRLLSNEYLEKRWKTTYKPSIAALPAKAGDIPWEGHNTTHFSVIDSKGNAVSITTTINDDFGSGFVPAGTGVVMNDQMDDFSIAAGVPNMYGLVGSDANSIAPGKKPLSSMSPTMVLDEKGNVRIVIGAMGGPRIITAVFEALFNRIYFGMSLLDAVAAPRIHHQWKPQDLFMEPFGFPSEVRGRLKDMGYSVKEEDATNKAYGLERFPSGRVVGAPDPRGEGAAVAE